MVLPARIHDMQLGLARRRDDDDESELHSNLRWRLGWPQHAAEGVTASVTRKAKSVTCGLKSVTRRLKTITCGLKASHGAKNPRSRGARRHTGDADVAILIDSDQATTPALDLGRIPALLENEVA